MKEKTSDRQAASGSGAGTDTGSGSSKTKTGLAAHLEVVEDAGGDGIPAEGTASTQEREGGDEGGSPE